MNIGGPELLFILILALLIFGPKKLPEVGRTIGRGLGEFRRASNDLKRTIEREIEEVEAAPVPTPSGAISRAPETSGAAVASASPVPSAPSAPSEQQAAEAPAPPPVLPV